MQIRKIRKESAEQQFKVEKIMGAKCPDNLVILYISIYLHISLNNLYIHSYIYKKLHKSFFSWI